MGVYEENIIPVKLSRLAEYMSEIKRISLDEALMCIYANPLYRELYNEGAKWWYIGTPALYEEFELRRGEELKEVSTEAFDFYVYTLEKYAQSKSIGGLQAMATFKEYGVEDYLLNNYDLLHTQGTGYVLDEIDRFIIRRKRR